MTRPRKQTVDWFPHRCNHGATIFILESKYQEAGYAFWFKLLEVLGSTEGHRIDCKDEKRFAYLCAYTKSTPEICLERMELLARMEAIDKELWTEGKIIWCQNFVDGIHAAYRNRQLPTPDRPSFERELPGLSGVSSVRNPERKEVEEVEEGKKKGGSSEKRIFKDAIPPKLNTPLFNQVWKEWMAYRVGIGRKPKDWNSLFAKQIEYLSRYEPEIATEMINRSIRNGWIGLFEMKDNKATRPPTPENKHAGGFNTRQTVRA